MKEILRYVNGDNDSLRLLGLSLIMRRYILIISCLLVALMSHGYTTETIDNISYRLYADTKEAHIYEDIDAALIVDNNVLVLPESVVGNDDVTYKVTGIEYFRTGNSDLKLVTSNTMTFVSDIRSGVKILRLSKSITSVEALQLSKNLEGFEISNENESFSIDENGVLYNKDKTFLYFAPYGKRASFTRYDVPSSVKALNYCVFEEFNQLEFVSLPECLKEIGWYAFKNCPKLAIINFPSTLEVIGQQAFYGCVKLLDANFSENLQSIGDEAFYGCVNLRTLKFSEGTKTIGAGAFSHCYNLTNVTFSNTIETIPNYAFYRTNLGEVKLPSNLQTIGRRAFEWGCSSNSKVSKHLQSLVIPSKVTSIGSCAFCGQWTTFNGLTYDDPDSYSGIYDDSNCADRFTVDTIYSYVVLPTSFSSSYSSVFGNISKTILVVPTGSKVYYEHLDGWKDFGDRIEESDELLPSGSKCSTPKFVRNKNILMITTEPSDAVIYYTLDGNNPTESSQVFDAENPIELTENCTVKAIAMKTDIKNSEIATFTVDWFKVEDVVIGITEDLMIEMKTKTGTRAEGVTIRYTLNGEDPAVSGHEYHDKAIYVEEDCTIKAVGIKKNFHNSDITTYELKWASMTCPTPEFRLADKKLYIEVKNMENTTIYYTLSGEEPTEKSLIYTPGEPVELSANCTVKAIATKKGYRKSAVGSFDASPFVVNTPTFSDAGTSLTINCETEGSEIYYGIGENVEPTIRYQSPITLTDNRPVRAIAKKEGYKDSEIAAFTHSKITCDPATLEKYDGHYFTLNVPEGTTAYYTLDGSDPRENGYEYSGITAVTDLCTLRFVAKHQYKNDSEVKNVEIKYFSDDESAKIKEAGQLQQALEWQDVKSVKTLKINGPLNATDYAYIRNEMTSVEHLDLEDVTVDNNILPDEAFAGMQSLISFTSPSPSPQKDVKVGERILANCPKLAAVVWNLVIKMGDSAFGNSMNPNMLVYVVNSAFAPSGTRNRIVNGTANTIVLSDEGVNGNFYCPKAFKTNSISYVRNFSMKTEIGKSMGWETIVLPFTVQRIVDSQGEIIPYKKFEEGGSDKTARPFWLRGLATGGFEDVSSIEANTPYIISMPNNEKYASHYNITGNVTFLAGNVNIGVTEPIVTNNGSISFVPCLQKKEASPDVWALNVNQEYDGKPAGSVFVPSLRDVKPFEAHTTISNTSSARAIISISEMMNRDNITDIDNILYDRSREINDETVKVYTISGVLFKTGKRSEVIKQLPAGMYVVDGKKIVIKK